MKRSMKLFLMILLTLAAMSTALYISIILSELFPIIFFISGFVVFVALCFYLSSKIGDRT